MKKTDIFINRMQYHLATLLLLLLLNFCTGQQPADKGANAKTKATLDFIVGLQKEGMIIFHSMIILICHDKMKVNIYLVNLLDGLTVLLIYHLWKKSQI
jgi:hypothetical protein